MRRYAFVAAVPFAFAAFVAVTGGLSGSFHGVPFSARRIVPVLTVAWAIVLVGARRSDPAKLDHWTARVHAAVDRSSARIAVGFAMMTLLVGVVFGAFTAAGADPYGYVSQAELWARGNPVQLQSALAMEAPWPNAEWSFCPLGYKPSIVSGVIVPTYAPGLPLQMAAPVRVFGPRGAYFVVPLMGALVVWLTFVFARHVSASTNAALVSALLVALSPPFMFQLMQPMSDVPVTAWWLVSIVAALEGSLTGAFGAGVAASLAILTRPNIAPLVIPVAASIAFSHRASSPAIMGRLGGFVIGLIPGVGLTAAMNAVFYGSALTSGYGTLSDIYRPSFAAANLVRYPMWLFENYSPYIFLALVTPLIPALRRHGIQTIGFGIVLGFCYLFYTPFEHWTYLRFLLPAIPLMMVMATASVAAAMSSRSQRFQMTVFAMIATGLGLSYLQSSVRGDAFALKELFDDRYRAAGVSAHEQIPARGAVMCLLQSGSLRYYANRLTVRYNVIDREWIDRSVQYLRQQGWTPYLALETTESAAFAERFGHSGALLLQTPARPLDPKRLVTLFGPLTDIEQPRPSNGVPRRP